MHLLKMAGVRTKTPPGLYFGWGKRLTGTADGQPAGGNQPQGQQPAGRLQGQDEWERMMDEVQGQQPDGNQGETEWDREMRETGLL